MLFVVDAKAGVTPGDEEVADILRRSRQAGPRRREQDRRPGRDDEAVEFHRLGLGDPLPISALHGYGTGDLLDLVVERPPGRGAGRGRRGRDPRGDPRPAERRQVEPPERDPRRGARDRLRPARERRATRSTPFSAEATRPSSSSTRPACAASAATGRGSSTTPSCARSRRPSAPTWRSSSSTRAKGSSTRISPSPTSRARPGCSTLVVLSKWDVAPGRDRGRPPAARDAPAPATAGRRRLGATTGRGVGKAPRPRRGALRQAHGARPDR